MKRSYWEKPVTYEENQRGGYRTITSTEEAANALLFNWPVDSGDEFRAAQRVFIDVLEGKRPTGDAREAFVRAAEEAGVFIRDQ